MSRNPQTHPDHERCVLRLRDGEHSIIGEEYLRLREEIVNRSTANSLSVEERRELFQSAFEDMIINFHQPDFVLTCPVSAYLRAIFRNKMLEFFRKSKGYPVRLEEYHHPKDDNPSQVEIAEEENRRARWHRLLRRTFALLSERCRSIFDLTLEKTSADEIARRLEMTNANAVYQARLRCRDAWQRCISQDAEYSACKPEGW